MVRPERYADSPESLGLDPGRVDDLIGRARKEVAEGRIPAFQLALARHGRVAAFACEGEVTCEGRPRAVDEETLFVIFSCTKAITASAAWILMQEGKLDPSERAAEIVPEFGSNGKDVITVEQLLTHTSGFPTAPYPQHEWHDHPKRLERFAQWRLSFEPGSRYFYHPTSSLWVVAEIIERRTGTDFREFVRRRIAEPLGLSDLWVGLPAEHHARVADIVHRGEEMTEAERERLGFPEIPESEVTEEAVTNFNRAAVREDGVPGGGGITTAAELALFYQALLDGGTALGTRVWEPETLERAREVRTGDLREPFFPALVNRALGVVIAGDAPECTYRGFGHTGSPLRFGHGGAGGQIGWADPETGLSFAFVTNGFDRHVIRQARRGIALSSRAAACVAD